MRMGYVALVGMAGALGQMYGQGTTVRVGPGVVQAGTAAADPRDAELERDRKMLADWPQLGRYAAANKGLPARQAGRVVFYGDSITDAWAQPGNAATFFPGKPYVGRGISGQTTPQMVVRFQQDVVDLHPEAVVILAGTNDIAGNTGPMTPEMTEENFKAMAEMGKANGIRVVICSILPVGDYPWRRGLTPAPKIEAINGWLKEYAAKEGLTYVDYWTAMADASGAMKDGLSVDGVHPNAAGYAIMERLVGAALGRR